MPGRVTFKPGEKVKRLKKKLDDPSRALKQIGVLMVGESQRAFKQQKFGRKRWDARAPVNVFGIIADFHQGRRRPPARRFDRRPALRDTNRLSGSIAFQVRGTMVEVGTKVRYASVHQFGGDVESKPITKEVQRSLWRWLKGEKLERRRRLGWLLNPKFTGKTLKGSVPARPFVGITKDTRRAVRKIIGVEIMEVR